MDGMPDQAMDSMNSRLRKSTVRLLDEVRCRYGTLALTAFGFLGPQGHAGAKFGLLFLFLFALAYWRRFIRDLARDPFFLAWCLLAVYLVIRGGSAALEFPSTSPDQWRSALLFAGTGFFAVLISWWIAADPKRVMLLLGAALAGFSLEVVVEFDPERFEGLVAGGQRHMLGSALPMGLTGAVAIVGLLVFLPRLLRVASGYLWREKVILYSVMAGVTALLMFAQIVTQSRAVIGMLIVLVPAVIIWQFRNRWNGMQERAPLAISYMVVIGLFMVAVTLIGPKLVDKFEQEYNEVAPYLASGELQDMPESSFGWRIHLNMHGSNLATERPWTGWGPGTSSTHDLKDRYDAANLGFLRHLHNTYLEILVRLGLIGALLYLLAAGLLLWGAIRARPSTGRMPGDVGTFLVVGCALMAGWSLIDFRLLMWDFLFPLILLASLAHTFGARWGDGRVDQA